jgi:lipopolysaccharide transport system permease protein
LWAVLQPLFAVLIFTLFLGKLARVPSDGVPYPIFSFAALVPWTFVSGVFSQASTSLVNSADMIKKTYFPRLVMPIASMLGGGLDLLLAFIVLLVMVSCYGFAPTLRILWIPALMLLAAATALGISLWLSALYVRFRDVRHAIPFVTQAWFFATPIVYSSSLLSEPWRTLYALNPMVGVVDGFRWALLGTPIPLATLAASEILSSLVAALLLATGALYFRKLEKSFADVI